MQRPNAIRRPFAWATLALWAATSAGVSTHSYAQAPPAPDNAPIRGRIVGDALHGFHHQPLEGEALVPLDRIRRIEYPASHDTPISPETPYRLRLADGGTLSGRLESLDANQLRFQTPDSHALSIQRAGLGGIHRSQSALPIFHDQFAQIDPARWQAEGAVEIDADPASTARLTLRGPGASLRLRPFDPVHAGRVVLTYRDDAQQVEAQRWSVELRFDRPAAEPAFLRIIPGWDEETLAVEATRGPWLVVRPIPRTPGPHQLVVRFDSESITINVDGRDLAHGDSPGESLNGLSVSVEAARAGERPPPPVAIAEAALERFPARPSTGPLEPSMDAVTRNSGDQLYGSLVDADATRLRFDTRLGAEPVDLSWSDIASVDLRRHPSIAAPALDGLWVRVAWAASSSSDPHRLDQLEGVLLQADAEAIRLDVPYIGHVAVATSRLRTLEIVGKSRRLLIDPHPHHLGDRNVPDLDPPDAEGDLLDWRFTLDAIPADPAFLVVDTIQLIGLNGTPTYSELVRRGELRTRITLNAVSLPDLNTGLNLPNDESLRLRLPIPPEVLRIGENSLRLEQTGSTDDPDQRDDFGLRRLALEWPVKDREP